MKKIQIYSLFVVLLFIAALLLSNRVSFGAGPENTATSEIMVTSTEIVPTNELIVTETITEPPVAVSTAEDLTTLEPASIMLMTETPEIALTVVSSISDLIEDIPDTSEAREIKRTIEKAYFIDAEVAINFNIDRFSDVYVNDPRFPVNSDTLETIRQMTANPDLEWAGWLDYKIAYNTWARDAILHAEAVKNKAKAENRSLTEEERKSLTDQWGRSAPAREQGPIKIIPVTYLSMKIENDVAIVDLIHGIYRNRVTLVLIDKKWYIAYQFMSASP